MELGLQIDGSVVHKNHNPNMYIYRVINP